jgi:DNA-binding MarR family transcriptional regulator/GNAT superfamily N-acetyltransferase
MQSHGHETDPHVERVRRFSRFYTQRLGLLHSHLLDSGLSLPEARLLFEVAQRSPASGADMARHLSLDPGYVSRLLSRLEQRGLALRRRSTADARRREFRLSAAGSRLFKRLDERSRSQVSELLQSLSGDGRNAVVQAMDLIRQQLGDDRQAAALVLRAPEPGDMGWVVQRHGALYHQEYGWDATFEAMVARISAEFIEEFDGRRERGWIAERAGDRLGSAFLVHADEHTAKIRLVLVEPRARGTGLGRRLVQECLSFARSVGYRRVTLWTNHVLTAARHIYQGEGFTLESSEPHHSFGHDLVGEYWTLDLD